MCEREEEKKRKNGSSASNLKADPTATRIFHFISQPVPLFFFFLFLLYILHRFVSNFILFQLTFESDSLSSHLSTLTQPETHASIRVTLPLLSFISVLTLLHSRSSSPSSSRPPSLPPMCVLVFRKLNFCQVTLDIGCLRNARRRKVPIPRKTSTVFHPRLKILSLGVSPARLVENPSLTGMSALEPSPPSTGIRTSLDGLPTLSPLPSHN